MLYASDLITQYLPWYYLVQQSLRQWRLPHWLPDIYATGYPLLAEGETGVLSPINAVILWLFSFPGAVMLLYVVYALIAITGMGYFLRRQGLSLSSSLLGGMIFTLSGFMLTRYFQPSIIFAAALLPWGFLYLNSYLLPFIIYLQITAGHLQIALISILGYIVYSLKPKTFLLSLLGLGLSAVQLLPTFQLYQLSDRRLWDPMVRFTYSLPPSHLVTYIFPQAFGISAPGDNLGFRQFGGSFWEFNLTIWTLPFLLSLLPLVTLPVTKNRTVLLLYLLWLLFLVLSFGGYTPAYRILARSPEFPFRAPSRFLLIPTFTASALAAYGFNQLFRRHQFLWLNLVLASVLWQATNQLAPYVITQFAPSILSTQITTPLPLSQPVDPGLFVVKFHQGLIISLTSLIIILYVKTHHRLLPVPAPHRH